MQYVLLYAVDTWSTLTWKNVAANPYVEDSTVDSVTPGWAVTCIGEKMMAVDRHKSRHSAEHEARGRNDSKNQRSNIWNCRLKRLKHNQHLLFCVNNWKTNVSRLFVVI